MDRCLAAPQEWDRFYIFADWLDEQGLELEAEQWRWRGQFFGQWIEMRIAQEEGFSDIIMILEETISSMDYPDFAFNREFLEDMVWCRERNLRYVPKWPVTLEDVRKGRDEQ